MDGLSERLRRMSNIGKKVLFYEKHDKGRKRYQLGEVVDEVSQFWSNPTTRDAYNHFIQKIDRGENGIRFRFCYYTVDGEKTKIVFGQYASQMDNSDFKKLIAKAQKKGFF